MSQKTTHINWAAIGKRTLIPYNEWIFLSLAEKIDKSSAEYEYANGADSEKTSDGIKGH